MPAKKQSKYVEMAGMRIPNVTNTEEFLVARVQGKPPTVIRAVLEKLWEEFWESVKHHYVRNNPKAGPKPTKDYSCSLWVCSHQIAQRLHKENLPMPDPLPLY